MLQLGAAFPFRIQTPDPNHISKFKPIPSLPSLFLSLSLKFHQIFSRFTFTALSLSGYCERETHGGIHI
ncbi:hypothetical protein Hdeb2414_s0015g00452171 [Helianthus debilis subsp. tardiflorus]